MTKNENRSLYRLQDALSSFTPAVAFVVIILGALIAFEVFNYSTTDHALRDLLGDLRFAGIRWSTILALAFCGIDFAGIARLFTPEQGGDEPKEVWYLFAAWLLAATMNAVLTWWGVSMAVVTHTVQSSALIDSATLTGVVPVFVAIMVWVIRILIIGTLSIALDRIFHPQSSHRTTLQAAFSTEAQPRQQPLHQSHVPSGLNSASRMSARPAVARQPVQNVRGRNSSVLDDDELFDDIPAVRPSREPTYHTLAASPRTNGNHGNGSGELNGGSRARRS